ncbi:MAG: class I SAM-dependent methyltransferase [Bacteroidia bacterium]|nr:class I SAM-dependent methyltransferase [Bacteroidia bacterium]
MSKIGKLFKALRMIAVQPWLLNHIVESDGEYLSRIKRKYGISALPTLPLEYFLGREWKVEPYSFLDGTSTPVDLALLRALAARFTDCRYLEIGTWRGESAANVAAVAKECVTVNLPDHTMREMGLDERYIHSHRMYSGKLSNVKHVQANSLKDDLSHLGKFDLIFIDGDHHYSSVISDTRKLLPLLKDSNSIIVWHDYAFSPLSIRGEVFLGILDGLPSEKHSRLYQPSNSLCCVMLPEEVKSYPFDPFPEHTNHFIINVQG